MPRYAGVVAHAPQARLRDPREKTAAHPEEPSGCHFHKVGRLGCWGLWCCWVHWGLWVAGLGSGCWAGLALWAGLGLLDWDRVAGVGSGGEVDG